ncbi:hypothetical protein ONZ45_g14187 [Pleurotus djamor]|nr:hypothetical protein ONZ45_g14187 [Pleurotus djamor]
MISFAVFDVLAFVLVALFILTALVRACLLPVKAFAAADGCVYFVICMPPVVTTVAFVLREIGDLLIALAPFIVDVVTIVTAITILRVLPSLERTPIRCLDVALYSGPRRLPYLLEGPDSDSPSLELVAYTGNRNVGRIEILSQLLSSTPSLIADSSTSSAFSSVAPCTPDRSLDFSLAHSSEIIDELASSASSLPCIPSSPTIRQLQVSEDKPVPTSYGPLIGAKERVTPMLVQVNGRSEFSDFPIRDLLVEGVLGQGAFGTVFLALKDGETYAVKKIEKAQDLKLAKVQRKFMRNEIEAQSMMSETEAFFVGLRGAYESSTHYFLIMPFCQGGDLEGWISHEKRFSPERTVIVVAQILHMIDLMTQKGVLHRDLKPANLLLDQNGYVRASDFGFAHRYMWVPRARRNDLYNDKAYELNDSLGTPAYAPPEMMVGEEYNRWVDLYALGIMTYEMLTGEIPDRDELETESGTILDHPDFSAVRPEHAQYLDSDALDFIKTLVYNPLEPYARASISSLKTHPFLREAPWHEIENNEEFKIL